MWNFWSFNKIFNKFYDFLPDLIIFWKIMKTLTNFAMFKQILQSEIFESKKSSEAAKFRNAKTFWFKEILYKKRSHWKIEDFYILNFRKFGIFLLYRNK